MLEAIAAGIAAGGTVLVGVGVSLIWLVRSRPAVLDRFVRHVTQVVDGEV